ncbi:MAG TPA: hypothetical protein DEB39_02050, partial [Planctomycetaceae bacterium]|nr:hypothetical protein [Planctomycetaceae bacterium]
MFQLPQFFPGVFELKLGHFEGKLIHRFLERGFDIEIIGEILIVLFFRQFKGFLRKRRFGLQRREADLFAPQVDFAQPQCPFPFRKRFFIFFLVEPGQDISFADRLAMREHFLQLKRGKFLGLQSNDFRVFRLERSGQFQRQTKRFPFQLNGFRLFRLRFFCRLLFLVVLG